MRPQGRAKVRAGLSDEIVIQSMSCLGLRRSPVRDLDDGDTTWGCEYVFQVSILAVVTRSTNCALAPAFFFDEVADRKTHGRRCFPRFVKHGYAGGSSEAFAEWSYIPRCRSLGLGLHKYLSDRRGVTLHCQPPQRPAAGRGSASAFAGSPDSAALSWPLLPHSHSSTTTTAMFCKL